MYRTILVPLENSSSDETILAHVKALARLTGSCFVLLHVADGWAARNFDELNLAESEEIQADRRYLQQRVDELAAEGFEVDSVLEKGEPSDQIIRVAAERHVDLIAMATHGHRFLGDLIHGSTADKVRHLVSVPVLLVKGSASAS
ncbi:MAG: universal stress protein [Terrimicrobiaceae bacterium]|nr:universal stress protein [Terrimicrobiaceae bacterium]